MKLITTVAIAAALLGADAEARQARRSGRLIVKLKETHRLAAKRAAPSFDDFSRKLGIQKKRHKRSGLLEVSHEMKDSMTEEQMAAELMASGLVDFAEPDYIFEEAAIPDDPKFNEQWMHRVMKTPEAWDQTVGSSDIIVAVCDSGVDATHPELQGRVLTGYNAVTGSNITTPLTTHGTKVAGLIAAAGNDGVGMAGMAWKTKILPIRISRSSRGSAYLSDMAECIEYAADHGAKVINLSFTGFASQTINRAAQYARSKGSLLFMAAGNAGNNVDRSPDYKSFILVGATTSADQLSSFSNRGTPIDIVAPGTGILTTSPGNKYATINGTSFSSPIAAGLGALVWSINPDFTPDQVENIIFSTTDKVGPESTFGHGRINASRAIASALEATNFDRMPVAEITAPKGRLVVGQNFLISGANSTDDHGIVKYDWEFADGSVREGKEVEFKFDVAGDQWARLTVTDTANQSTTKQIALKVSANAQAFMHVNSIRMTVFFTRTYSRTESRITVKDEAGLPVAGAVVKADVNGEIVQGITDASGIALVKGGKKSKKFLHKLKLTSVEQAEFNYNEASNVESDETIQVR